jgi:hypothetical protein
MQSIKLRQRVVADGILHLDIPTGILEGEVEATVTYQELTPQKVDDKGWPIGFLETVIGGWFGEPLERPEQRIF